MEKVIIGVDAGGTKTKVCAITKNKEIVYEAIGGTGSPAILKHDAFNNIYKLVDEVKANVKDKYLVTFVQLGISGLGVVNNIFEIEKEFTDKLQVEVSIENDVNLGLYSIIEDKHKEGILVLSGTGSACSGINNDETMMIGGFGQLLTEGGSSYASVKMLVCRIILNYEETKTFTELGSKFMREIKANTIADFRLFMYSQNKNQIAEYSKFISQQALEGNEEAIQILIDNGDHLAHSVKLLYKHLNLSDQAVIGFRGSFIQKAPFVKETLLNNLNSSGYYPKVVDGLEDPVYGALYMALKKGKI